MSTYGDSDTMIPVATIFLRCRASGPGGCRGGSDFRTRGRALSGRHGPAQSLSAGATSAGSGIPVAARSSIAPSCSVSFPRVYRRGRGELHVPGVVMSSTPSRVHRRTTGCRLAEAGSSRAVLSITQIDLTMARVCRSHRPETEAQRKLALRQSDGALAPVRQLAQLGSRGTLRS